MASSYSIIPHENNHTNHNGYAFPHQLYHGLAALRLGARTHNANG